VYSETRFVASEVHLVNSETRFATSEVHLVFSEARFAFRATLHPKPCAIR
jgi:hypothetical protein